jgi:putative ABC transport system substrate-binding protein
MISRRHLMAAVATAVAAGPHAAMAQPKARPAEIAFLHPGAAAVTVQRIASLSEGLRQQGWVEGRDFTVLPRAAEFAPERMQGFADEMAARNVQLIFAVALAAERAARKATRDIPIVGLDLEADPIAEGFVVSLARPGNNMTGIFFDFPEFSGKWLELLSESVPTLRRVAALWDPATAPVQKTAVANAARSHGLEIEILEVRQPGDVGERMALAKGHGAQAVLAVSSPIFGDPKQLADTAVELRMPAIAMFPDFAQAGGLMAYGPEIVDLYRQSGVMVAKVLQGRNPADLPVERPERIRLSINLKTANALGLKISLPLLGRADEVIE